MIEIALTNVPFDATYSNVIRFDNESARDAYFKIPEIFNNSLTYNFNAGEFYITTKRMQFQNTDVETLMNANYCIIHDLESGKYFFYFIQKSTYLGGKSVELSLELDIFQTYYLATTFTTCNIRRACLERFDEVDDETVKFKTDTTSPFFQRDDIQDVAKRMTKRTVLNVEPANDTTINQWFADNIAGWNIYFVQGRSVDSGQDGYKFFKPDKSGTTQTINTRLPRMHKDDVLYNPSGVLPIFIEPVMKFNATGELLSCFDRIDDGSVPTIDNNYVVNYKYGFDGFRQQNNNNSYVFVAKFVPYTPFVLKDIALSAQIVTNTYGKQDLMLYSTAEHSSYSAGSYDFETLVTGHATGGYRSGNCLGTGVTMLSSLSPIFPCEKYTAGYQLEFKKSEIVGAEKSPRFNPKLLTADYRTIKLTNEREQGFEYDPLKLGTNTIETAISDAITPDTTRTYFRITNTNGIYIPECSQNLTGCVDSADTSLMVDNDQLSAMLAQNKNYFLQSTFKVLETGAKGLVAGALGGIPAGATAGAGIVSGLVDQYLTIDNMRNAPNEVKNANGSVYFNRTYTTPGPTIEEYDILDNEKEIVNDYNHIYGFTYNRIGNIKDFDHLRKYFDFVSADLEMITSKTTISAQVRNKFKEIFANGVRFWHDASLIGDYSLENYERSLENGTQV